MPFLASEGCFWPLTASMTSEVQKKSCHVYPCRNLSIFSEINFSHRMDVWFDHELQYQSVRTSFDN